MVSRRGYLGKTASVAVGGYGLLSGGASLGRAAGSGAGETTTAAPTYEYERPELLGHARPLGGGAGYEYVAGSRYEGPVGTATAGPTVTEADATAVPETPSELLDAADDAEPGDVIWLPDRVFDFTDANLGYRDAVNVTEGVTLASGRGVDGNGAVLYTEQEKQPLVRAAGDGARITGVRFETPWTHYVTESEYENYIAATLIGVEASGVEIDNCVLQGAIHAGIEVGRDATGENRPEDVHVHHCEFVDNACYYLGYGVVVFEGEPYIHHNYFDHNRHAIAGDGHRNCSYHAEHNLVGEHAVHHQFDMHDYSEITGDAADGGAGERLTIRNNTFLHASDVRNRNKTRAAVGIRGVPREVGIVERNLLAYPAWSDDERFANTTRTAFWIRSPVEDVNSFAEGNVRKGENLLGDPLPDRVGVDGERTLPVSEMAIVPSGSRTEYQFSVTGNVFPAGNVETAGNEDWVGVSSVRGSEKWMSDNYRFTGEIDAFEVVSGDSDIDVWVEGSRYSPGDFASFSTATAAELSSELSVIGPGDRTDYRIQVSGQIAATDNVEPETGDRAGTKTAEGSVEWYSDNYRFSGFITDFEVLSGADDVTVWADGKRLGSADF